MKDFYLLLLRTGILGTIMFIYSSTITARHIVGGEMVYECLGIDTVANEVRFEIRLQMYRDGYQGGGQITPFDDPAEIGVHRYNGSSWEFVRALNIQINDISNIDLNTNPCVEVPPNILVDQGVYSFDITLPILDQPYMFSYQRCCRNNTISNIINPGGTGAAISVEISPEAQRSCNSSPDFVDFPPVFICAELDFVFDHSAFDADGDQLVYEFCAPLASGGTAGSGSNGGNATDCDGVHPSPRNCRPPFDLVRYIQPTYSATSPLTGDPALSINSITGLITGVPNMLGQYVVGVCVKEFRNGELIGTVRRDFQFNVTICEPSIFAELQADASVGDQEFLLNSCGENTVTFINQSYNEENIDSYLWEFEIDGDIVQRTTRDATVTFPGVGEYFATMVVNPFTECSDTASIYVNVYPDLEADFRFDYDTCYAGPVSFEDLSYTNAEFIRTWEWDFGDGNSSTLQDPAHTFSTPGFKDVQLTIEDVNECIEVIEKTVDYHPVPQLIVVEPSTFVGCAPGEVFFNNLSTPVDENYDIYWEFGDGNTSTELSPTHIYEKEGIYSIYVSITSPLGCVTERHYPNYIRVQSKPKADFDVSPKEFNTFNTIAYMQDKSTDAIGWEWAFDSTDFAYIPNPTHTFQDTGIHEIRLVVFHPNGCTDTAFQYIDVVPVVNLLLPNAFSPNGDGKNEVFVGKGSLLGLREYSMRIWARWGESVFDSEDPFEGWNGRKNNTGKDLPDGVYVYKVRYVNPRDELIELDGFATLIR